MADAAWRIGLVKRSAQAKGAEAIPGRSRRRAHHRLDQSLPPPRQGLRASQPNRCRRHPSGQHQAYAQKAHPISLFLMNFPDGLLEDSDRSKALSPENEKKLVEELNAFTEGPNLSPGRLIASEGQIEVISIERHVHRKRGSSWQVPKDLPDSEDS